MDTGGGNLDVVLPDRATCLSATVKTAKRNLTTEIGAGMTGSNTINATSGAGNVLVRLPRGLAARIHAITGLGRVAVESRFTRVNGHTYRSPDYDDAVNKVEITLSSGAGNVRVSPID